MKRTNFLKILPFLLLFPIKSLFDNENPIWRYNKKWEKIQWEQVKKGDILKLWVNHHERYEITKATSNCYRNENGILTIQCTKT
jgi:hypothetical protein